MRKFDSDTRNTGGLKVINDHMYNHHKALINAKPAIKIKPPKPVSSKHFQFTFSKACYSASISKVAK